MVKIASQKTVSRYIVIDHGQVRADASPAALKALVSNNRVSFDVSEPLQPELFAQLTVRQLELGEHHVSLLTPKLETVLRALFTQPVEITNLAITGASLEEAFFHLTQDQSKQEGKVCIGLVSAFRALK